MDLPHQPHEKLHYFALFPIFTKKQFSPVLVFLFLLITSILFYNFLAQPHYSLLGIGFLSRTIPQNKNYSYNNNSNSNDNNNGSYSNTTLKACEYSNGEWVWDESHPLRFYTEDCPFLDPGFRCRRSGRTDFDYLNWRWQPQGCDIPRFNATDLLERSRNGRIVFAGDSIGRNQWESLICMLAQGVSNISTIYEENGSPLSKHKGHLSIRFQGYNLTVEYYREPFLVSGARLPKNAPTQVHGVLRIDKLHWYSSRWVGADVIVFNTGHWWNKDKTINMGVYFEEGESLNMTMDVTEAFRRSLLTWKTWVMQNLTPENLIFFRSYSSVHYRDGTWNSGGYCDTNTSPENNYTKLEPEPWNNLVISEVVRQIASAKRTAYFLNITYLTEFRKDGHPSSHREPGTPVDAPQDCSHWCLPGVPDTWNELLYAHLLSTDFRTRPI